MFGIGQLGRLGIAGSLFNENALWPLGASSPGMRIDGPSYPAACYQDSAGTTALSTVGTVLDSSNPIGLMLDRKGGLALGPELVTNGDFSNGATGWADGGVWSFSGGAATHSGGVAAYITQYSALSGYLGKILAITYTVTANVGGRGLLLIGAYWSTGTIDIPSTVGTHTVYAASGTVDFWLYCNAAGTSLTIDNISIREIPGLHLSQPTSAARPLASARKNLLVGTDALATQSVTVIAAQCVLSFTGAGTVTLSGVSTAGPLIGTGAADRVSLTFTPTAGSLTLTVSGSVTFAQLEYRA